MPPRGDYGNHFIFGDRAYGNYYYTWCKGCIHAVKLRLSKDDVLFHDSDHVPTIRSQDQLEALAKAEVKQIVSKKDILIKHLGNCQHTSNDIRDKYSDEGPATKRQKTTQAIFELTTAVKWNDEMTHAFNKDIIRFIASSDSSFNIVSNPSFQHIMRKWAGNPPLATRQALRQKYLKEVVEEVEQDARQEMEGKLAMGQCDGWKNVAKALLIAILATVEDRSHVVHVHNVSGEKKTADNLLSLVLKAMLHLHNTGVTIVGWVSDAGGDSRAMRLKLSELMPHLIVLDCWAHQINLVVGDYLKLNGIYAKTLEKATRVVKWFNNHSRALGLLQKEQKARNDKVRALINPCATRWTSHYLSAKRLAELRVIFQTCALTQQQELLEAAGKKPAQKETATEILEIIRDYAFWDNLDRVCGHLHPLAVAANVTQGSRGALYSVALTLAGLYRDYKLNRSLPADVRDCLLSSIEKRWAKTDQDSFLAAVILNPYLRLQPFKPGCRYSAPAGVYELMTRLWKRFFPMEYDNEFWNVVIDYCACRGTFSKKAMYLHERQDHVPRGMTVDILQLWKIQDNNTYTGNNQLVKLAIRVHSAVANSADCERFFSNMGNIHTKKRNRLHEETVRDLAVVKMAVQEKFKNQKHKRTKRKHVEIDERSISPNTPATSSLSSASTVNSSHTQDQSIDYTPGSLLDMGTSDEIDEQTIGTHELITSLVAAAENDDENDDNDALEAYQPDETLLTQLNGVAEPTEPGWSGSIRLYFGTRHTDSIFETFDFREPYIPLYSDVWTCGYTALENEETDLEAQAVVDVNSATRTGEAQNGINID